MRFPVIAIAGIHTGIGKTLCSAVLAAALDADYWKPVQAGMDRDSETVQALLSGTGSRIFPEGVLLQHPLSPHEAARLEGVQLDHRTYTFPQTDKLLLVETAGGVLSPISEEATMADFIAYHQLPAILIVQHYLGSINHTVMSIEALKSRGVQLLGLVVSGAGKASSEEFIKNYSGISILCQVPYIDHLSAAQVRETASKISGTLKENLYG
jgi:dethiobiotin synthetase